MSVLCQSEEIIVDNTEYNSDEGDDNIRLSYEDCGSEQYQINYYHTTSAGTGTTGTIVGSGVNHLQSQQQQQQLNNLSAASSKSEHYIIASSTPQGKTITSKVIMENEKKMRREIANSNERRRMQSINAGFQSLRSLLPHHEGEKLSKAAILQQTAQYIIELEREKTHLLSQNSQLKRLLGQHEIGSGGSLGGGGGGTNVNDNSNNAGGALKKRKLTDNVITMQTISDSSDEGLGSMSPEPVTLLTTKGNSTNYASATTKEIIELKAHLEAERKKCLLLEEQLRQTEPRIYTTNHFIQREVIDHTDNIREGEIIFPDQMKMQLVEIDSIPSVGQAEVIVCSPVEGMTEEETEIITDDVIREEIIIREESPAEYVAVPSRLQPILEAAIKAEPKVEVERINAPVKIKDEPSVVTLASPSAVSSPAGSTVATLAASGKDANRHSNSRMYLTNTSRQNLETIVEAIRHLEGDHLFAEMPEQKKSQQQKKVNTSQETPLALTNKSTSPTQILAQVQQRKQLTAELTPFLQIKKAGNLVNTKGITSNTVTIVTGSAAAAAAAASGLSTITSANNSGSGIRNSISSSNNSFISTNSNSSNSINNSSSNNTIQVQVHQQILSSSIPSSGTITTTSSGTGSTLPSTISINGAAFHKQCRPGVIVAKQLS